MNFTRKLVIAIMVLSIMQTIHFITIDAGTNAVIRMIIISIASVALCWFNEKTEKE